MAEKATILLKKVVCYADECMFRSGFVTMMTKNSCESIPVK